MGYKSFVISLPAEHFVESMKDEIDRKKTTKVFALMVELLNDKSFSMIKRDARNYGRLEMKTVNTVNITKDINR